MTKKNKAKKVGDDKFYAPPCYESHKPFEIMPGIIIHGGSCNYPAVKGLDIYVGFDAGMRFTRRRLPWCPGDEIYLPIKDHGVPETESGIEDFKKLVEWVAERLKEGKRIHVGCIGGHGRTGMFLSALVKHMTGRSDAIEFVRSNYCYKTVEAQCQIDFLVKHYGVDKADPYYKPIGKSHYVDNALDLLDGDFDFGTSNVTSKWPGSGTGNGIKPPSVTAINSTGEPQRVKGDVWGGRVKSASKGLAKPS